MIIDLSKLEDESESAENRAYRLLKKKRLLRQQLSRLKGTLPITLNDAFDRYFENRPLAYLKIEDKLNHLGPLFEVLEKQIPEINTHSDLSQVGGRISFVADRLDEIEAALYQRPRKRPQRGFNLADFFKHFGEQSSKEPPSTNQEISTLSEAYKVLGLEEGCSLSALLVAFRRLAKKHHPDARGGDRSKEQEFHRVMEAYQLIRDFLNPSL